MPYIRLQNLAEILNWRELEPPNTGKGKSTTLKSAIGHTEKRKISAAELTKGWKYCYSESPQSYNVYLPLTLDEYSRSVLSKKDLNKLIKDQVLARAKLADIGLESMKHLPGSTQLLSIGQTWLWKIEDDLIVSPLEDSQLLPAGASELRWDPRWIGQACMGKDRLRRIGVILSHLIDRLDTPMKLGSSDTILNTFEKSITVVSHKVDLYSRGEGVESIQVDKEKAFLHEIDDIREELTMLKRVVGQQEEVWKEFASSAWPEYWSDESGKMLIKHAEWRAFAPDVSDEWRMVIRPQSQFERFYRRIGQLDEDAERAQNSILLKVDLMAKKASMQETHATAIMSAAVFGFTVITIIFTPLSFITALFALPIDQFQKKQVDSVFGGSGMYTSHYIGTWACKWFQTLLMMMVY